MSDSRVQPGEEELARVQHVTVGGERSQKRSLLPWLSAALMVPAVVMLLNTQGAGQARERGELATTVAAIKAAAHHSRPVRADIKAAEAKGLVQAVSAQSKAAAASNVQTYSLSSAPGAGAAAKAGAEHKVAVGKSSADVKVAAKKAVEMHMLEEQAAAAPEAAAEEPPKIKGTGQPDKNPDKVLVKMYMEVCFPLPLFDFLCLAFRTSTVLLTYCTENTEQVPRVQKVFHYVHQADLGCQGRR